MLIQRSRRHEWNPGHRSPVIVRPAHFTDCRPSYSPWIKSQTLLMHQSSNLHMYALCQKRKKKLKGKLHSFLYHLKGQAGWLDEWTADRVTDPDCRSVCNGTCGSEMMNLGKTPHQPNPWPTELHRSTCNIYTSQRTIFTWSDTVTGSATKAQQGCKHLIA